MMKKIAMGLALALAFATASGVAWARGPMSGYAIVQSVDAESGLVSMRGMRFGVTRRTVLEDLNGGKLDLADLRARPPLSPGITPSKPKEGDAVYYEAIERRGDSPHRLTLLRRVEGIPR